jgi:hypothetical protein
MGPRGRIRYRKLRGGHRDDRTEAAGSRSAGGHADEVISRPSGRRWSIAWRVTKLPITKNHDHLCFFHDHAAFFPGALVLSFDAYVPKVWYLPTASHSDHTTHPLQ